MDYPHSTSGDSEDNGGIPEDLRCKRSDGKQWRCSAMSMPDKTVCEKHYIQAKKRAANSALRASLKKAKRKSVGESDIYLESKSDDMDVPLMNTKVGDRSLFLSGKKPKEKLPKDTSNYSPDTPAMRGLSSRLSSDDDLQGDAADFEEKTRSYKSPPPSVSSWSGSERNMHTGATEEYSDGSTNSYDDTCGQPCHQCRRNDGGRVIWCLRCGRRGYCDACIATWYPGIPSDDIQQVCPACRGTCNCKVCLRGDNLIKARIREIPVNDKLRYLHSLLSLVLPVIKQIHHEHCSEIELEKRLNGPDIYLVRTKLNADEQMCCNFCRIPITDYHRHCDSCSYDLCLSCCKNLRAASICDGTRVVENQAGGNGQAVELISEQCRFSSIKNLADKYFDLKANSDGSIPCPSMKFVGCDSSPLSLSRIFKMNWVAKLVKNTEEMVNGCKVCDVGFSAKSEFENFSIYKGAHREDSDDNFLYCPSSEDIKIRGIDNFRTHWSKGSPVIIKQVCDSLSSSDWNPMLIWNGIREITHEKMKDNNLTVKAIDCFDRTEVDIELGQFIEGYSEGRTYENGWPEMLKLKNWPSPSASEEFLLYQKPEFISKLPLLEYIHSKWGLLNAAAKLPHYSLQNDVGPKILISYGIYEELGRGDSVTNLHFSTHDTVYLLVHACEVKLKSWQTRAIEKIQKARRKLDANRSSAGQYTNLDERQILHSSLNGYSGQKENVAMEEANEREKRGDQGTETGSHVGEDDLNGGHPNADYRDSCGNISERIHPGALWDVFRRQDVPKLIEYLRVHREEFELLDGALNGFASQPLYDEVTFLNGNHKRKLKEEFGIEPWSFEQHLGDAVFVPVGCPFQVRNVKSTVQLSLDFLSPESLGEALRLNEEIRCLPNDHEMKLQTVEVGKMSLYAASSAIKEVQKLVLDPKLGAEIGFENPNLTAMVSENLEKMTKQRRISCS